MKALSIRQPWASLIIGVPLLIPKGMLKDIENRSWSTRYRGPLLIHASSRVDVEAVRRLFSPPYQVPSPDQVSQSFNRRLAETPGFWRPHLGAIIGRVDLVTCTQNSPSVWAETGAWHWVLANPKAFDTPVPYKGALGLFEVPDSAIQDA